MYNNQYNNQQATGERELGWDDEIVVDGDDFIILTPGDYQFRVKNFERGRFDGSAKMPACNMAILTLAVVDQSTKKEVDVQHRLFLHSKTEWTISAFFASIGMKQKGEKIRPNWSQIMGKTGKCKIGNREHNGNTYNEIVKFYPMDVQESWGF